MQETEIPTVDVSGLAAALREGAQLVDVRGAAHVPMGQLPARLGELDRSRPVHLVCASGGRSAAMARVVSAAGFEAVNVAGGTQAWIASGRAVERGLS